MSSLYCTRRAKGQRTQIPLFLGIDKLNFDEVFLGGTVAAQAGQGAAHVFPGSCARKNLPYSPRYTNWRAAAR